MTLRIALAQLNPTVGDIQGNFAKLKGSLDVARDRGVELLLFPELVITGYPPEDLLLKAGFVDAAVAATESLAPHSAGMTVVVGSPLSGGAGTYNGAVVMHDGAVVGHYHKQLLPNYGVFDERRYFAVGQRNLVFEISEGIRFGITICEDIWTDDGPVCQQAADADLIINISASPFDVGKGDRRRDMLAKRATENRVAVAYCNLVGGQDELIFDGQSIVIDSNGDVLARAPQFEECLLVADVAMPASRERRPAPGNSSKNEIVPLPKPRSPARPPSPPSVRIPVCDGVADSLDELDETYAALVLGTRDYAEKSGFGRVLVGLSGGIDSALVAVIASDALGPQHVMTVGMPTRYSSKGSVDDSRCLADNVGFAFHVIPIDDLFQGFLTELSPFFLGTSPGLAEENVQPRVRGTLLMALSNKLGALVLTTGNKSEIAVGYCTLYGDTAGGYAVLKDVPKTLVYALSRRRNERAGFALIPDAILEKAPSAELRPDQKDTDSLPPYEVLDAILEAYVVENRSASQIAALGFDPIVVGKVIGLIDRSEYKRRQSAPGVRISPRAFGKDWRLPIAQRYEDPTIVAPRRPS